MRQRCSNSNTVGWSSYGGRGIRVCKRWQVFENFLNDMGPKPSAAHTLDRRKVNGNYTPGNCRWAVKLEQARNCRNNRFVRFQGKTRCLSEWAEITGLSACLIRARLNLGWSTKRTLTVPRGAERRDRASLTVNGETKTVMDWARFANLNYTTLLHRVNSGWPLAAAVSTPLGGKRPSEKKQRLPEEGFWDFGVFW